VTKCDVEKRGEVMVAKVGGCVCAWVWVGGWEACRPCCAGVWACGWIVWSARCCLIGIVSSSAPIDARHFFHEIFRRCSKLRNRGAPHPLACATHSKGDTCLCVALGPTSSPSPSFGTIHPCGSLVWCCMVGCVTYRSHS
jgi:hypothetical protein